MIPLITARSLEDSRGNKQRFIVGQQKKTRGENIESHMCTKRDFRSSHLQLRWGLLGRWAARWFAFPSGLKARRTTNKLRIPGTLPSGGNKKRIGGHGRNLARRNTDAHKVISTRPSLHTVGHKSKYCTCYPNIREVLGDANTSMCRGRHYGSPFIAQNFITI